MEKRNLEWLARLRKRYGFTQVELAKAAGIAQSTYAGIESGATRPSIKCAKKIAGVLLFDWTHFFRDAA